MNRYEETLTQLEISLSGVQTHITGASDAATGFQSELNGMRNMMALTSKDARGLTRTLSSGLRGAFSDLIFRGASLKEVLNNVAQAMIRTSFNQAITPVTNALSGTIFGAFETLFGGLFAKGGAFTAGRVTPFAKGGVVSSATPFAMRGGAMGLMGEAGPEAIMPLARGPDGALGIRASQTGAPVVINMTVNARDAASFKRSQTQIAAGLSRAMSRAQRNR